MTTIPLPARQTGAALVVSLIMLVIMTLIGLSGMRTTILEERMAGNYRDQNLALQAAEAALREAEVYLSSTADDDLPSFIDGETAGLITTRGTADAQVWQEDAAWWEDADNAVVFAPHADGTYKGVALPPRYVIEELPSAPLPGSDEAFGAQSWRNVYRITARATGGSETARAILIGTYWR